MTSFALLSRTALAVALAAGASAAIAADPAPAPAATAPADDAPTGSEIIVTGTRASGVTVAESAAPIKLVGADAISHVGQPNLNQVLTQLVPSFTAESFGGDTANLTLSAALRGLSPNQTLVLVNGKRRHSSANLHILGSIFQGSASPDLDFITPASIDHIEVLEDGAAAQYGSDAIAGVINIIMKKKEGGTLSATGGQFYAGDGKTYSASLNYGWVSDRGFINLTGFYRFHDYSQRGGADVRVTNPDGSLTPSSPALQAAYAGLEGYPRVNPVVGDARSKFGVGSYNAGYDITDSVHFYSFGSLGFRNADSYENVRLPDRSNSIASDVPGVAGNYDDALATNPNYIFSQSGFRPQEALREVDYQATGGFKGESGNFGWDVSTSYGMDRNKVYTLDSKNLSLWVDHLSENYDTASGVFSPIDYNDPASHQTYNFYDGTFRAKEWTSDLDLTYKLGDFATLAGGAEYRKNWYSISPGEPASYYKTAAQSFAGYTPANSGKYSRDNYAFYADAAVNPIDKLKLDAAVRYEHYSDFGSKTTWKATGRYDVTPAIAIRGTAATGFRAPSLAEEHYSGLNVSPGYNYVQIPPNSAAAEALGIQKLKPETSTNYSFGVVLRPVPRLTITADAYQIRIKNRILGSGNIQGYSTSRPGDPVVNPNVLAALETQAGGAQNVDFTVGNQGILVFTNGGTTRTRGIDVVASYAAEIGESKANFTLSGNYGKTKVLKVNATPASISQYKDNSGNYETLFDATALGYITTAPARYKIIGGVDWSLGAFTVVARETYYGKEKLIMNDGGGTYTPTTLKAAGITDLEIDYHMTPAITLAIGANNLFDKEPKGVPYIGGETADGNNVYDAPLSYSPYGQDGGYYYARVDVKL